MTNLFAALTLLGAPAAALYAIRCAIQRQFRRERDGDALSSSAAHSRRRGVRGPNHAAAQPLSGG
jgi:hypothetical protein